MTELEQPISTLANARRWVVKIGSALTTNQGAGLNVSKAP